MRCRPGDLALIIKSGAGNEGKEVDVVRWCPPGGYPGWPRHVAGWVVRRPAGRKDLRVTDWAGRLRALVDEGVMPDAWLLPLRPSKEDAGGNATVRSAGSTVRAPA